MLFKYEPETDIVIKQASPEVSTTTQYPDDGTSKTQDYWEMFQYTQTTTGFGPEWLKLLRCLRR